MGIVGQSLRSLPMGRPTPCGCNAIQPHDTAQKRKGLVFPQPNKLKFCAVYS